MKGAEGKKLNEMKKKITMVSLMVGKYKVTVERVNEIMRPSQRRKLKYIY